MTVSMLHQAIITGYAAVLGAVLGLLWDAFRIARMLFGIGADEARRARFAARKLPLIRNPFLREKTKRKARYEAVVIFCFDLAYSAVLTVVYTLFLYCANNGTVRWYLLLGSALGFFVYRKTLGVLVMRSAEALLFLLCVLLSYVFFFVSRPLVFAGRALRFLFGKAGDLALAYVEYRYTKREIARLGRRFSRIRLHR